jgi:hypothetical protein
MVIVREVTEWAGPVANHIYVLNDSMTRMIAYVPQGSDRVQKFKNPIEFDRRGRKFEELPGAAKSSQSKTVEGSGGQQYRVTKTENGWTCTCPGWTYRGRCRHVEAAKQG